MRYGRDDHYDVVSAFIKSMRGSDPDAAVYWLARMLEAGEDPRFVARRMVIFASEDVGMADPQALVVATSAAHAARARRPAGGPAQPEPGGDPPGDGPQEQLARPAIWQARQDVADGRAGRGARATCAAPGTAAPSLGHGVGYEYPHDHEHDELGGWVDQQYLPDGLAIGRGTDRATTARSGPSVNGCGPAARSSRRRVGAGVGTVSE